ncbi:MAG TPA: ADP-ribosylation factor-like protein [Myxococcales bacterium]|nr:ADP-ribosylation factor-like protein [Myxococcales bacterium]
MQFNTAQRELTLKIVYYGPGLSGKTTNLRSLYQRIQPALRGHLMTLDTADDRTLFFDTLPLVFKSGNLKVKLKLFTVPGQVMHNSTRRIVLQGCDAIAFIADSQPSKRQENYKYWMNMVENLKSNGLSIESLPCVVQWNKKDLGDATTAESVAKMRAENKQPVFEAVAVRGEGIVETFLVLVALTFEQIDRTYLLRDKIGLDRQAFVEEVRRCLVDPPRIEDILPQRDTSKPARKDKGEGGGGTPGDPSTMAGGA